MVNDDNDCDGVVDDRIGTEKVEVYVGPGEPSTNYDHDAGDNNCNWVIDDDPIDYETISWLTDDDEDCDGDANIIYGNEPEPFDVLFIIGDSEGTTKEGIPPPTNEEPVCGYDICPTIEGLQEDCPYATDDGDSSVVIYITDGFGTDPLSDVPHSFQTVVVPVDELVSAFMKGLEDSFGMPCDDGHPVTCVDDDEEDCDGESNTIVDEPIDSKGLDIVLSVSDEPGSSEGDNRENIPRIEGVDFSSYEPGEDRTEDWFISLASQEPSGDAIHGETVFLTPDDLVQFFCDKYGVLQEVSTDEPDDSTEE